MRTTLLRSCLGVNKSATIRPLNILMSEEARYFVEFFKTILERGGRPHS